MSQGNPVPTLARPPVIEVICGLAFSRDPQIDQYLVGLYWNERKKDFPERQSKPAFVPELGEASSNPEEFPTGNTWLISADKAFVLQIQENRITFNWRRLEIDGANEYPHVSSRGDKKGMLVKFLNEVELFKTFHHNQTGNELVFTELTLSKFDVLVQGEHWNNSNDVLKIFPILGNFSTLANQTGEVDAYAFNFGEKTSQGRMAVNLATGVTKALPTKKVIRLESTIYRKTSPEQPLNQAFKALSDELNSIFGNLIPLEEMRKRFGILDEGGGK